MLSINQLKQEFLFPRSIESILSNITRRRAASGHKEFVNLWFDCKASVFILEYTDGQTKQHDNMDAFLQSLRATKEEGKELASFFADPIDYCFEQDYKNRIYSIQKNIVPLMKKLTSDLQLFLTPEVTSLNEKEVRQLWVEKYRTPQFDCFPPDIDCYVSCMADSPHVAGWAIPHSISRLATLENKEGKVLARSIVYEDVEAKYHNIIYTIGFEEISTSIQGTLQKRMSEELKKLGFRPLDKKLQNLTRPVEVGYQNQIYTVSNDLIRFHWPVLPYIDDPKGNLIVGLMFINDKFRVCGYDKADAIQYDSQGQLIPLTKDNQYLLQRAPQNKELLKIAKNLRDEVQHFCSIASQNLAYNKNWNNSYGLEFDILKVCQHDNYDLILETLLCGKEDEILSFAPEWIKTDNVFSQGNEQDLELTLL